MSNILKPVSNTTYSLPCLTAKVLSAIKHGTPRPDLEPEIVRHPILSLQYAMAFSKSRWAEAEPYIIHSLIKQANDFNQLVKLTMDYAKRFIVGRWPQLEPCILRHHKAIYLYSLHHIGGRWSEGESCLVNSPYWAYVYALDVIKGRWRKAEPYISLHPEMAYNYSYNVLSRRWPAAEKLLVSNVSMWSVKYAKNVLQDRWPDIEEQVFQYHHNSHTWQEYMLFLLELATKRHNPKILEDLASKGHANKIKNLIRTALWYGSFDSYPYILRKKAGVNEYYVPPADYPYW